MNRSIHRISLDIHKIGSQTVLNVKKGDTARSICITLTENGRPYEILEDCSAAFSANKPDGNYILNDCAIQDNEIVYDFTPQTAPVAGAMECEVSLYDKAGNQITSPRFLIIVDDVVYNDEEIVSSDEANFLKELISEVNSTVDEVETKLANGEFIGEKGEKGDQGDKGDAGVDGTNGQDGVSATHEWNGTVLTVTSASGASSADLKGDAGNDGYTPIKGVDYWTDSEQAELLAKSAPPIVCESSGEAIVLEDSSGRALQGLKVYGKTEQEDTPSPENPQALISLSDIEVRIQGTDTTEQTLVIPNMSEEGFAGIPVKKNGNYTDSNGQQWICDEVDFARGVYVQRIGEKILDGTESWTISTGYLENGSDWYYRSEDIADAIDNSQSAWCLCDQYPAESITNNKTEQGVGVIWKEVRVRWGDRLTLDEWLAKLSESPVTVKYVLAEPVETTLDDETLAAFAAFHTNKPNTTITTDAGAWMSADYVADTKLYIDNKFAELAAAIVNNS